MLSQQMKLRILMEIIKKKNIFFFNINKGRN